MMTGEDFIALAVQLAAGTSEAEFRTSVSRTYYGAFHVAKQLLEEMGVHLPKGEQVHLKLGYCLQDCGEPNAAAAGIRLEALRARRNRADYDLSDNRFRNKSSAESQVVVAQEIIELLGLCCSAANVSEFRSKVRTYASQVLRLRVSE